MTVPTTRSLTIFGVVGLALAIVPAASDASLFVLWTGFLIGYATFALLDLAICLRGTQVQVNPTLPTVLYAGGEDVLSLDTQAPLRRAGIELEARVDLDPKTLDTAPPERVKLDLSGHARIQFPLVALRRGRASIRRVWIRWRSPLGLWRRTIHRPGGSDIPIVPHLPAIRAEAIHFFDRHQTFGIKPTRQLGQGSEFDELREFRQGHDPRHIDWKASAHHRKLVARHFRAERNHQVILAFDTGWLMGERVAGLPKIDHAIRSGLLLAYLGLRTGDRVGLFAFDQAARCFLPPQSGVASLSTLQDAASRLEYTTSETNFTLGITDLSNRLRRRSLIILMTDFVDTVSAELMLDNVERLARRHLIIFVALRDPAIDTTIQQEVPTLVDLNVSVLASEQQRERERVFLKLKRLGVIGIDVEPSQVSSRLINSYLDVRKRELVG